MLSSLCSVLNTRAFVALPPRATETTQSNHRTALTLQSASNTSKHSLHTHTCRLLGARPYLHHPRVPRSFCGVRPVIQQARPAVVPLTRCICSFLEHAQTNKLSTTLLPSSLFSFLFSFCSLYFQSLFPVASPLVKFRACFISISVSQSSNSESRKSHLFVLHTHAVPVFTSSPLVPLFWVCSVHWYAVICCRPSLIDLILS